MTVRTAVVALLLASPLIAEEAGIKWHFTRAEGWGDGAERNALTAAGWTVNTYAARAEGFKIVYAPTEQINGALELWDHREGIGVATLTLKQPIAAGELQVRLGTLGRESQYARLELLNGEKILASIVLRDNSIGQFTSGAGTTAFGDTHGWLKECRTFRLTWAGATADKAGTVSFAFTPEGQGAKAVEVKDVAFAAPGVPNRLRLKAGDHAGSGKGLLIDELIIKPAATAAPAPAPAAPAAPAAAPEAAPAPQPAPAKAAE